MTVKELIESLQRENPDATVVYFTTTASRGIIYRSIPEARPAVGVDLGFGEYIAKARAESIPIQYDGERIPLVILG